MSTSFNLTGERARRFATEWIESWNSHDLGRILTHYAENVVLTSPIAARLLNLADGMVTGKAALRNYFQKGLEAFPELRFELIEVMWGLTSVVLHHRNQAGTKSGEFMKFNSKGKVVRVVANYSS
jgi:predicted ester cyclase